MHAALVIAAKDLRARIRDRSGIVMSVVAPLLLATLFSTMLPSSDAGFHTTWVVADLDGGPVARELVDGALAGVRQAGVAEIAVAGTDAEVRKQVKDGTVAAGLVIPAGFSEAVAAGRPAELSIAANGASPLSGEVLRSVVESFAGHVEAIQLAVATVAIAEGAAPDPSAAAEIAAQAAALADPIVLQEARTDDRVATSKTFYGASMAVLFVFFAAQFGVTSLLSERRNGTLARMLASPIRPSAILAGKVLVSIVIAVVSMVIIVVATTLFLGARWGDPVAVGALIVAVSLAASGIALLAVGLTRTEDQATGLIAIIAMTLSVLGGSFFPMSQAPEALASLSVVTPHAWFLRGINDLAGGGGIGVVVPSLIVLLGVAAVTGGIGLLRARDFATAR